VRLSAASILSLAAVLLVGCGRGEEVPAEPQRSGDAQRGRDALLNRAVVTCGLPVSAYRKRVAEVAPELMLPDRTGLNAELPYSLTARETSRGVELVTSNCLSCHAAPLNGELVIGLGNEFLDFTKDPLVSVEGAGAYVKGKAAAAEWRKWADRIAIIAPYRMTDTVGVNPADNLILALFAHRDPETLAWSDKPILEPPSEEPLPVSVPPLWNVRKKHAFFYNAAGRGDQVRLMMLASATCTDTIEEAEAMDAWLADVRAYLVTLEPPRYPYPIDPELAEEGQKLFGRYCRSCHGSYGKEESFPNKLIALEDIGTDPALARDAYENSDRFVRWYNSSFYGKTSRIEPVLGYMAPPLDGVWATAPYLHNGSVPTLAVLLESASRPRYWRFAAEEPAYDAQGVGWAFDELPYGKNGAMSWEERYRNYDTSLRGYSNQGHDFGADLTQVERLELVEYLKTL